MSGLRWMLAVAALASAGGWTAFAQVPEGADERRALRAEIDAGRDAAESLYREQVAQCRTRFIVSSCVEAASKQRHDTLKRLDSQQTAIDDVEREERAAERRDAIARKEADEEARSREAEARARAAEVQRAAPPKRAAAPAVREMPAHKAPPSPQERAAREASARAAYAIKQLQAEARRQEAARRNAEHAKKTNPAAPLPVPGDVGAAPHGASSPAPAAAASAP